MAEMVTVRNPRSGNTARVPRSALPQMPKWREVKHVKPGKSSTPASEPTADEAEPEES